MTNEPSWLRTYIGELAAERGVDPSNSSEDREAGLTEPTETDPGLYGVGFEFEGKRIDPAEVYLADREAAKRTYDMAEALAKVDVIGMIELDKPRIDEMTLADYRRGIANMKTRYV